MKKSILSFALFLFFALCMNAQTTEKKVALEPFSKIKTDGIASIILVQSNENAIKVVASTDSKATIDIDNEGEWLKINIENKKIGWGSSEKNETKMQVYIYFKNIDELKTDGVGSVKNEGKINLNKLDVRTEGVGSLKLENININDLQVNSEGVGSTNLSGRAKLLDIKNNGVGSVHTLDLYADIVEVENNGVGSVKVFAAKEISIKNDGIGSVHYKGDASVKHLDKSGVGSVKKM
jgi:hypothetical protein